MYFHGVTVNAMNPGLVATSIGQSASGISAKLKGIVDRVAGMTPEEGAQTIIYLATSPEVIGVSGKYFVKEKSVPSSKPSYDLTFGRRLWEISERLTAKSNPKRGESERQSTAHTHA